MVTLENDTQQQTMWVMYFGVLGPVDSETIVVFEQFLKQVLKDHRAPGSKYRCPILLTVGCSQTSLILTILVALMFWGLFLKN